jgi:hypothetical protein
MRRGPFTGLELCGWSAGPWSATGPGGVNLFVHLGVMVA